METKLVKAKCPAFQSEVLIVIVGLPSEEEEIPLGRVKSCLSDRLHCDPKPEIINAERMRPRRHGPGVIKVEQRTQHDKVAVLCRRQTLRDNESFNHIYIHSVRVQ